MKKESVQLECQECGRKFKTTKQDLFKVKCPNCHSQDLEVD
jgi:Zn finger protein HypA/HybF involved in hydrogenase expression